MIVEDESNQQTINDLTFNKSVCINEKGKREQVVYMSHMLPKNSENTSAVQSRETSHNKRQNNLKHLEDIK